jgi:hypothetical protein
MRRVWFQAVNITALNILIVIALVLSIIALIRPQWPLCAVGLLLVCVALLAGKYIGP